MSLTLSVVAPYWLDRPPGEALEVAAAAETLGIGEMWLGEMMSFNAAALGGAVAAHTRALTVTLGPLAVGVHSVPSLAMMLGSVETIGERPARLALGASSQVVVERWHGRAWRSNAQRLTETVAGVRQAAEGKTSLRGGVVHSAGFRPALPITDLHVTVAALGPEAVAAAAESGDRVVVNLVTPPAAGEIRRSLDQLGAQETRLAAWVVTGGRSEPVRVQVAAAVCRYLAAPGYVDMLTAAGFGQQVAHAQEGRPLAQLVDTIGWDLLDAIGLFGSRRELEAGLRTLVEHGVSEVCAVPATADDPAGRNVLSALTELV